MLRHLLSITVGLAAHSAYCADRVLFLNSPESVTRPIRIAREELPPGTTRIFFHYVNRSGRAMAFRLHVDRASSATYGVATNSSPGAAGLAAALMLRRTPATDANMDVVVAPGKVVSGAMDVAAPATGATARCSFGDPPTEAVVTGKNSVTPFAAVEHERPWMRVGEHGPGRNEGDYGVEHRFTVTNDTASAATYRVYASPRGGHAGIVWAIDGQWHRSGVVGAKRTVRLATITVAPGGSFTFTTVPVGGYSYPLETWAKRVV